MRVFATGEVGHALLKRGRGGNGTSYRLPRKAAYRREGWNGTKAASVGGLSHSRTGLPTSE